MGKRATVRAAQLRITRVWRAAVANPEPVTVTSIRLEYEDGYRLELLVPHRVAAEARKGWPKIRAMLYDVFCQHIVTHATAITHPMERIAALDEERVWAEITGLLQGALASAPSQATASAHGEPPRAS